MTWETPKVDPLPAGAVPEVPVTLMSSVYDGPRWSDGSAVADGHDDLMRHRRRLRDLESRLADTPAPTPAGRRPANERTVRAHFAGQGMRPGLLEYVLGQIDDELADELNDRCLYHGTKQETRGTNDDV